MSNNNTLDTRLFHHVCEKAPEARPLVQCSQRKMAVNKRRFLGPLGLKARLLTSCLWPFPSLAAALVGGDGFAADASLIRRLRQAALAGIGEVDWSR